MTTVTIGQHQLFDRFVQGAVAARADLHEAAWIALGVLLLLSIFVLSAIGVWLLQGGFSRAYHHLKRPERAAIDQWFHEP